MPFLNEEENNPFRPSVEQSTYGFEITTADNEPLHDYSFGEEFEAGFKTESWVYREVINEGESTTVEDAINKGTLSNFIERSALAAQYENFDAEPFMRKEDEDFKDWYAKAANKNDISIIQSRIDEQLESRKIVENGGAGAVLGMISGAVLSPELLIPVAGEFALLSKGKTGINIARTLGMNLGADGIHELINYSTDRTYSEEQLGYAMLGSALINGAFGGFAYKGLKAAAKQSDNANAVVDSFVDEVIELGNDLDPLAVRHAGAAQTADISYEIKSADLLRKLHLGLASGVGDKRKQFLPSSLLGAVQNSRTVQKINVLLYENSLFYKENAKGIAMPASAELRLEQHKGRIVDSYTRAEKIFGDYQTNTAAPMKKAKFNVEVSRAIRAGTHDNAHVAKTARMYKAKVFNPLLDELKRIGKLEADVDPHYLTRIWKREAVIAKRPILHEKLVTYFKSQASAAGKVLDDSELGYLEDAANNTITNILGGDIMGGAVIASGNAGVNPLKKRALDIPDDLVEEFIENDIDAITSKYVDSVSKVIEKERLFKDNGWESIADIEKEIRDEFQPLLDAATNPKELAKLQEELTEAVKFADQATARVFGTEAADKAFGHQAITDVMKLMTLSKLGSVLLASVGDIARITQEFGHTGLGSGIKLMLHNASKNAKKEEYGRLGVLTERVLSTRLNAFVGVEDTTGVGFISRYIDKAFKTFGAISGMKYWNDGLKTMAVYAGEHSILKNASKLVTGETLSPKAIEEMARWGVSKDIAARIGDQFTKHGDLNGGMMLSNIEKWDDPVAFDSFVNALTKMSLQVINTPTKGTLPHAFDSVYGKALLQFKSFLPTSHVQTLVPMVQTPDAKRLVGTAEMIMLGSAMYYFKEHAYNDDPKTGDWKQIIVEGVDKSGVVSLVFEGNNMLEKATGNTYGIRPALGITDGAQRYRNVNLAGALAGPTAGALSDVSEIFSHAAQGDLRGSDLKAGARLTPFYNLFYTRWATDRMIDNLADKIDK